MSEFSSRCWVGISRHCQRREVPFAQQTLLSGKAWRPRCPHLSGLKAEVCGPGVGSSGRLFAYAYLRLSHMHGLMHQEVIIPLPVPVVCKLRNVLPSFACAFSIFNHHSLD